MVAPLKTTTGKFFCHSDFGLEGHDCSLAETSCKFDSKSVTMMADANLALGWSPTDDLLVDSFKPSDNVEAKDVKDEL